MREWTTCPTSNHHEQRLSYKFQRLREQLRRALESGDLSGQLPGERELGKRFEANAKTVNKALCDLASEGWVVRKIGRGTFAIPRNGQNPGIERPRTLRCLLAETSAAPHRAALVDHLRTLLHTAGHRFYAHVITDKHAHNGHSLLSDWPSTDRRDTQGLYSMPADPLSGGRARLGIGTISEILRRHLPTILIGALSESTKLSSVTPDFMDAGFRLTEQMILSGVHGVIVLTTEECQRETELVVSGATTSAARHQLSLRPMKLPRATDARLGDTATGRMIEETVKDPDGRRVGLLCIGSQCTSAVRSDPRLWNLHAKGLLPISAVLEAGDMSAAEAGMTWYDVEPRRLAEWAVRLWQESHIGDRPVEVMIPGRVRVTEKTAAVGPGVTRVRVKGSTDMAETPVLPAVVI